MNIKEANKRSKAMKAAGSCGEVLQMDGIFVICEKGHPHLGNERGPHEVRVKASGLDNTTTYIILQWWSVGEAGAPQPTVTSVLDVTPPDTRPEVKI